MSCKPLTRGPLSRSAALMLAAALPAAALFPQNSHAGDTAAYVIHTFPNGTTADSPHDGMIFGPDGALYGTTFWGGTNGDGTVFKVTLDGTETVLHNFGAPDNSGNKVTNTDGMEPNARLVLAKDGNFYGVTTAAGPNGAGTLFKVTPSGQFSVVHAFDGPDYGGPDSALIPDAAGNLWGLGINNTGAVLFRYALNGTYTEVHTYAANESAPDLGMVFGSDGNLYGASNMGGANGYGDFSRITTSGVYTELYVFNNTSANGFMPITVPAQGKDGNFYGIAAAGGANNNGVLYKITPSGAYTVLHSFDPYNPASKTNIDGDNIAFYDNRDLTMAADGSLWGSLGVGGAFAAGTNFRIGTDGSYNVEISDDDSIVGNPEDGKLLLDSSGNFYGVTGAGDSSGGSIFKLVPHSGTSVNATLNLGSVKLYHPVKLSWTSSNASSCKLIGDFVSWMKVSVPLNGSRTWYPGKKGRQIFGVQCTTPGGGFVNSSAALTVN